MIVIFKSLKSVNKFFAYISQQQRTCDRYGSAHALDPVHLHTLKNLVTLRYFFIRFRDRCDFFTTTIVNYNKLLLKQFLVVFRVDIVGGYQWTAVISPQYYLVPVIIIRTTDNKYRLLSFGTHVIIIIWHFD